MRRTTLFALAGLVLVMGCVTGAHATPIELILVVDGSGSINDLSGVDEWALQMEGYHDAILAVVPTNGSVAIAGVVFSSGVSTFQSLTTVTGANIGTIADAFLNADRSGIGSNTDISLGIQTGEGLLTGLATTSIIDVSTDGNFNLGVDPAGPAGTVGTAAWAVENGNADLLNALGIGLVPNFAYGPGSFNVSAPDFASFQTAIESKLSQETGIPEPGTMALLGIGLLGIGGVVVRRRRRS